MWRIFAGRFQPPHSGHLWVIRELVKQHDRLVIGVVNAEPENPIDLTYPSFHPLRNPFSFWERTQMLRAALESEDLLKSVVIIPLRHPRATVHEERSFLPQHRIWVVPPLDEHEKKKIVDLQLLGEEVEEIEVPARFIHLSSSILRNCLLRDVETCLSSSQIGDPSCYASCYPSAIGDILRQYHAGLRIEQLALVHTQYKIPSIECPKLLAFLSSEERSEKIRADLCTALEQLAGECRNIIDALYQTPEEREERKKDAVVPAERLLLERHNVPLDTLQLKVRELRAFLENGRQVLSKGSHG